jgi:methionyl-tRNA formyltransferase
VYDRLTVASFDLLDEALERLEAGHLDPMSQDRAEATYRPNRKPKDGWIDWRMSSRDQYNFVRALTDPYPGAFTFFESDRLTVWDTRTRAEECPDAAPGEVVRVIDGVGVDVCTGGEVLRLKRVQLGDRPQMWADEFADRHGVTSGRVLGRADDVPEGWFYTGIRDCDGSTHYDTNLRPGETCVIRAVAASPTTPREFRMEATLGGRTLVETTRQVHGEESVEVRFRPAETGIRTLTVAFSSDGDRIDTRYLKVFVTE